VYWYDDNEDNVNPLNPEEFDPVVDKIFKANALELEKIYAEIGESRQEIILELSKTLVPDQSLLPEPGYTIAQIKPKVSRLNTSPEDEFQISGQSDTGVKYQYYFTPLFEHNYPKCDIVAIITENAAYQVEENIPEKVKSIPGGKNTNHFWIGMDLGKVKENDVIPFFLGDKIVDEFDKDHHVFHTSRWSINGRPEQELPVRRGVESFRKKTTSEDLLEAMDVPNGYEKQIFSRFRNSFLLVPIPVDIDKEKFRVPPHLDGVELTSTLSIDKPICWIKVELSLGIPDDFLAKNILYPNTIPLVNRRLKEKHVVKSNYDRILLPMPTTDIFLDVHKVQDAKNKGADTQYQRVDFLHKDNAPGMYTLRSGSRVRRLNREDATRQIYRLLGVIQDEYSTFKEEGVNRLKEDFDVIEKSLNRIKSHLPDLFRDEERKSSYFCIANFRPGATRLSYQYWETQGELIKHLGDKTGLAVSSSDAPITDSKSVIPIQKGKGELTADDYINQLRVALLSRGKILTKADVKLYCRSRYGHLLRVTSIEKKLMMMEDSNLGRGVLVTIKFLKELSRAEMELIRVELQNDLNAKSAFFTHIKVAVEYER
jgi:hypothetical protein